ncbi:MAG TPA: hypothetical protein VL944_01195 [Candidatus Acidoferrum sp.]|nr:hypothetical protein [Candidatus Acidoferrum sp.]
MDGTTLKPRRVIGWDVDDTLFRSTERIEKEALKLYGVGPDQAVLRREGIDKAFPTLSKEQVEALLGISWENPDNPPRLMSPNIPKIFDQLHALDFQNAIVTASRGNTGNIQLVLQNCGIDYDHFVHVTDRAQKIIPWVLVLVDNSPRTASIYGEAGRPVLWFDNRDIDNDMRASVLKYETVIPFKELEEVPELLKSNEKLREFIRRAERLHQD